MWALLLPSLTAELPATARYVMEIAGVPAGFVSYAVKNEVYTYTSAQIFRSSQHEQVKRLTLGDRPEVWWLSAQRPDGCTSVTEELTGAKETVCIDSKAKGGTIDGKPFRAAYRGGHLVSLELAGASVKFVASSAPLPERADPFLEGFELKGTAGELRIVPPAKGTHAVSNLTGAMRPHVKDEASCLELARAFTAQTPGATVVTGVVIDEGRAWPHAWVQLDGGTMLDPSVPADAPNHRKYMAFLNKPGTLYLELSSGRRSLELRE